MPHQLFHKDDSFVNIRRTTGNEEGRDREHSQIVSIRNVQKRDARTQALIAPPEWRASEISTHHLPQSEEYGNTPLEDIQI